MLANEHSGSGGDFLPWAFQRYKLGPVVGKRTWGGLVGIGGYPSLIDGGGVTAPHFAFWTPEGKWEVENRGVPPDVEIEFDPKLWRQGRDPQLEKAVELVLEGLAKTPPRSIAADLSIIIQSRWMRKGGITWPRRPNPRKGAVDKCDVPTTHLDYSAIARSDRRPSTPRGVD